MTGRKGYYPKWKPKTEEEQRAAHAKKLAQMEHARKYIPKYRYEKIVNMVKEAGRVGEPAKVAEFTKGIRDEIKAEAARERRSLHDWLEKNRPMEIWEVNTLHTPGTWSEYELWLTYGGDHESPAAMQAWRRARKQAWLNGRNMGTATARRTELIRKTSPLRG